MTDLQIELINDMKNLKEEINKNTKIGSIHLHLKLTNDLIFMIKNLQFWQIKKWARKSGWSTTAIQNFLKKYKINFKELMKKIIIEKDRLDNE